MRKPEEIRRALEKCGEKGMRYCARCAYRGIPYCAALLRREKMLKIEVNGDNVNVNADGGEVGVLIRDAMIAVATMVDAIRLSGGLEAAEAFLLYLHNMDSAGAYTMGGEEE